MNRLTDEQKNKLPKWARTYVDMLENKIDSANRELDEVLNREKEGPITIQSYRFSKLGTNNEVVERKFQGREVLIEHADAALNVYLAGDEIRVSWGLRRYGLGDALFTPTSYQQATLKHPKHART